MLHGLSKNTKEPMVPSYFPDTMVPSGSCICGASVPRLCRQVLFSSVVNYTERSNKTYLQGDGATRGGHLAIIYVLQIDVDVGKVLRACSPHDCDPCSSSNPRQAIMLTLMYHRLGHPAWLRRTQPAGLHMKRRLEAPQWRQTVSLGQTNAA